MREPDDVRPPFRMTTGFLEAQSLRASNSLPAVARALDVRADDGRPLVVRQVLEEVRLREVERVAV